MLDEQVCRTPNDAVSKMPGRNQMPRLIRKGWVAFDNSRKRYVLTAMGHYELLSSWSLV